MTVDDGRRRQVAELLAPHGEALAQAAEVCRAVAASALAIELPPIGITVDFVAPPQQRVHHDGWAGVRIAVAGLDAFDAPPAGANLRYALCHEVGHLSVLHARDDHRSPSVVWDEALAHLLAAALFLPALPDGVAPIGAGSRWREVEIEIGETDADPSVAATLRRCTAELRHRADAGPGLVGLLRQVGDVPASSLRADRFLRALDRVTHP